MVLLSTFSLLLGCRILNYCGGIDGLEDAALEFDEKTDVIRTTRGSMLLSRTFLWYFLVTKKESKDAVVSGSSVNGGKLDGCYSYYNHSRALVNLSSTSGLSEAAVKEAYTVADTAYESTRKSCNICKYLLEG